MACGCKKGAAASTSAQSASVTPKTSSSSQEATPQKKIVNRIIKREIR
jgi:hypothetical protein